jgi:hypothetical protein
MAQAPASDVKDEKFIVETIDRIYAQIEDMFKHTVTMVTNTEPLNIVIIITHTMLLLSDIASLSGANKKNIVIKVIHKLLTQYLPVNIQNDPSFKRLYLDPIDSSIDTLYWVSLQGAGFFKKSKCCSCF